MFPVKAKHFKQEGFFPKRTGELEDVIVFGISYSAHIEFQVVYTTDPIPLGVPVHFCGAFQHEDAVTGKVVHLLEDGVKEFIFDGEALMRQ